MRLGVLAPFLGAGALARLAIARVRLVSVGPEAIHTMNRVALACGRLPESAAEGDSRWVAIAARLFPGLARLVPWRSDCLVQAMAAQRWLMARGVATRIVIGVDRPTNADFAAHAWLSYGEKTVTGGEIERFTVLLGDESGPDATAEQGHDSPR